MTVFIIYNCGDTYINELCLNDVNLHQASVFIPQIGETFIDKKRNVEYEVKDIIRSINLANEYGVQVLLQRRTEKKYK